MSLSSAPAHRTARDDGPPQDHPGPRGLRSDLGALAAVGIAWLPASLLLGGPAGVLVPLGLVPGTAAAAIVGLVLAALAQPLVGAASDRRVLGLRRTGWSLVGVAAAFVGIALLAVGVLGGGRPVIGTILAQLGAGILVAAQQPLLPEVIARRSRARAAGIRTAFELAGATAGAVLVAAVVSSGRPELAVVLLGALLAVATLGIVALHVSGRAPGAAAALGNGAAESRHWRGRRAFWWTVGSRVLFVLGAAVVLRVLPALVAATTAVPVGTADVALVPTQLGPGNGVGLDAALGAVAALMALPGGWLADRLGRRAPLVAGAWAGMFGSGALAMSTDPTGLLIGALLVASAAGLCLPAQLALCVDLVPARARGEILGLAWLASWGAIALSSLAAPISMLSAGVDGLRLVLAIAAVVFAGSGLAGLRASRYVPIALILEGEMAAARPRRSRAGERPRRT